MPAQTEKLNCGFPLGNIMKQTNHVPSEKKNTSINKAFFPLGFVEQFNDCKIKSQYQLTKVILMVFKFFWCLAYLLKCMLISRVQIHIFHMVWV